MWTLLLVYLFNSRAHSANTPSYAHILEQGYPLAISLFCVLTLKRCGTASSYGRMLALCLGDVVDYICARGHTKKQGNPSINSTGRAGPPTHFRQCQVLSGLTPGQSSQDPSPNTICVQTEGMPCTQCARSAKFWMSANTRTLVLAPFHKFLVPYQGFFGFPSI